mgnify:CR=1 FL=1
MGRRPLTRTQAPQVPVAGFTPEVQSAVNRVALSLFEAILPRILERIEKGELDKMNLPKLLGQARKMMAAVKGPSTSITAIQIPVTNQMPTTSEREVSIINGAKDPEKLAALRLSAERFAKRTRGKDAD